MKHGKGLSMFKYKSLMFEVLTVIALFVIGCQFTITNVDDEEDNNNIPFNTPRIFSFTITDSFQQTSFDFDQQVHLNAGVLGGEFDVFYSASADGYYVSLSLNDKNNSGGGVMFFNGVCGFSSCVVDLTCRFTNAIKMSCGNIGPGNQEVDVSSLVTAIPMDAYIILQVCNAEYSICVEQYQAVELQ